MMRLALPLFCFASFGTAGHAETVVAKHTIRPQQIITSANISILPDNITGMASRAEEVMGLEAKRIIYAGRPIALKDIGPPALVERNQIIPLSYRHGGLIIQVEGRALGRGGQGDLIRAMNLGSRATVTGEIGADGTVWVNR